MDNYFRLLGVRRGSTEEEMRKAYKTKALMYHPDRNPNGVEIFKNINEAYEALQIHYKKNNGKDRYYDIKLSGNYSSMGYGPRSTCSPRSSGKFREWHSSPILTEEELFGNLGLKKPTSVNSGARNYTDRMRGFRQRDQYRYRFENSANPEGPPTFNDAASASDAMWKKAHGSRKPESAYNIFRNVNEMNSFMKELQHFDQMELRKKSDFFFAGEDDKVPPCAKSNGVARDSSPPEFGRRAEVPKNKDRATQFSSNIGRNRGPTSDIDRGHEIPVGLKESNLYNVVEKKDSNLEQSKANLYSKINNSPSNLPQGLDHRTTSGPTDSGRDGLSTRSASSLGVVDSAHNSKDSSTYPADGAKCNVTNDSKESSWLHRHPSMVDKYRSGVLLQRQMDEEWAAERRSQEAILRAEEAMRAAESKLRKEKLAQETLEEWNNTQRQMELDNTTRDLEERISALNRKIESNTKAIHNMGNEASIDNELRRLANARRQVKYNSLSKMLPSTLEVSKLALQDIYILNSLFEDMSSQVRDMLGSRIAATRLCLVCSSDNIDSTSKGKHSCRHGMLCSSCLLTSVCCPLCGV